MSSDNEKQRPAALSIEPVRSPSTDSGSSALTSSSSSSLKPARTARFAEATTVVSPLNAAPLPFSTRFDPTQPQPADVGFGYIGQQNHPSTAVPMTPASPLRSALKTPGTPGRGFASPLSPTWKEEELLETREKHTEKEQKRDLKIKTRVRMAKFAMRGVGFSCSLIVVSMVGSSLAIFNSTRSLAPINGMPPWADNTVPWPQILVLACSCLSLLIGIAIFLAYCRGGHRRAEKVGVYYTLFAVGYAIFSLIMFAAAAGILQFTRNNSGNKDVWGWSCVENDRSRAHSDVDYALVCRLQNWALICIIIDVVIEALIICLYSIVFYRYWTKRRLHRSMDVRDKARSDMYLAQLRSQSAPNTPGPKSPAFSSYAMSPRLPPSAYQSMGSVADDGGEDGLGRGLQPPLAASQFEREVAEQQQVGFKLQAPPTKANKAAAAATSATPVMNEKVEQTEQVDGHAPMVEGEKQYDEVPIPGAYEGQAVRSPPPVQFR